MKVLLAGIGILAMLCHRQSDKPLAATAPPLFSGVFLFVGLMVTGPGLLCGSLCVLAVRLKKSPLIAFFVLAFLCSLCMGYLSSRDFTKASLNWVAQGVNTVGQGALFAGAYLLHKGGLSALKLRNEEIA